MGQVKILILAPVGSTMHLPPEVAAASRAVREDTVVEVRPTPGLPKTIYVPPVDEIIPAIVAAAKSAEQEGFDAIGISCCSDPGLQEVRAAVSIPVSAPFEAFSALLPALGPASIFFIEVEPGPGESVLKGQEWIPELASANGISKHLLEPQPIPVERPTFTDGDSTTVVDIGRALLDAQERGLRLYSQKAVERAAAQGAKSIFPSCTYWTGLTDIIQAPSGTRVLDPVEVLARHLETLARAAIRHNQEKVDA